jgi:hypothetical protein
MAFTSDERTMMQADGDAFLSSSLVVDLLLDARNDCESQAERNLVDRDLARVRGRHLVAASEVRHMLDELDAIKPAPAPAARRVKRRFGH